MKNIKLLVAAAELTPIAKTGGLGDVIGALPKAVAGNGCEVKVIIPFYGLIDSKKYPAKKIASDIDVFFDGKSETIELWQTPLPGTTIDVWLIKHRFFAGKEIYNGGRVNLGNKYSRQISDIKRFAFFSRATLEAIKELGWQPDVIHCNDWHVAIIADYLKQFKQDEFYKNIKTLYTIHNLANQGVAKTEIIDFANLDSSLPAVQADAKNGDINFMVQGILNADLINTVSPTYAKEILTKEHGAGLDNILKMRKKDLSGIINGIDIDAFNPETDPAIEHNYNLATLEQKTANKLQLQAELGLPVNKNKVLVGLVSRLVNQKGLDLINEKFGRLDCQFVFLGTGQKEIETALEDLAKKFPNKISAQIKFDNQLAQRIYAAADMFLMPSRFEPCGLGQMIAMRYGTVPIVRATGGLADSVNDKVGFKFEKYDSNVLHKTISEALNVYYNRPADWKKMQAAAMRQDFSWQKSAKKYIKLYNKLANLK